MTDFVAKSRTTLFFLQQRFATCINQILLSNCLNWKIYCDNHSSLSSTTAVQKWKKKNELFHIYFTLTRFVARPVWSWVVKRATSLFNSFCSNVAKQVACFCCPFYHTLRNDDDHDDGDGDGDGDGDDNENVKKAISLDSRRKSQRSLPRPSRLCISVS